MLIKLIFIFQKFSVKVSLINFYINNLLRNNIQTAEIKLTDKLSS